MPCLGGPKINPGPRVTAASIGPSEPLVLSHGRQSNLSRRVAWNSRALANAPEYINHTRVAVATTAGCLYNANLEQSTIPRPRRSQDTAGTSATARLQPLDRQLEKRDATHSFLLDVAFSGRPFGCPLTPAQSSPSSVPSESVLSLRTFLLGRSVRLDISKGECPAADAYLQPV